MLHLVSDTPATWVAAQEPHVDVLLLDHTHCEKKAASTAMNLIFRYQFQPELMRPLSALAREELEHFEMMLDVLADERSCSDPWNRVRMRRACTNVFAKRSRIVFLIRCLSVH